MINSKKNHSAKLQATRAFGAANIEILLEGAMTDVSGQFRSDMDVLLPQGRPVGISLACVK